MDAAPAATDDAALYAVCAVPLSAAPTPEAEAEVLLERAFAQPSSAQCSHHETTASC